MGFNEDNFVNDIKEAIKSGELIGVLLCIQAENDLFIISGKYSINGYHVTDSVTANDVLPLSKIRKVVQLLVDINAPLVHIVDESSDDEFNINEFVEDKLHGLDSHITAYSLGGH